MKSYPVEKLDIALQCKSALQQSNQKVALFSFYKVKRTLARLQHNWKTRAQLQRLNEAQLKDLGLTSSDVYEEVHKPLWK